jgi:hypothetical protein
MMSDSNNGVHDGPSDPAGSVPELMSLIDNASTLAGTLKTFKAVRQYQCFPPEVGFYLVAWAIERIAERRGEEPSARHFREFGEVEMADLLEKRQAEFRRLFERGRRFIFGTPGRGT